MHNAQLADLAFTLTDWLAAEDRVLVHGFGPEMTTPTRPEIMCALLGAGLAQVAQAMRARPAGAFVLVHEAGAVELRDVAEDASGSLRHRLVLRVEDETKPRKRARRTS